MPNTEVKLTNAESTWPEAAREDRKLLINLKSTYRDVGAFFHFLQKGKRGDRGVRKHPGRNKLLINLKDTH